MNYGKAIGGAVIAAAAAITAAAPDGITLTEWFLVAAAAVAGFGGVYAIKPGPGLTTPKPLPKV
jgi:hypothetical protein